MKKAINWKLFVRLLIACVVASFMVLPYTIALSPSLASIFTPVVIAAQVVQASVIFSISIFLGLLLAKKVGFGAPVLEGKKPLSYLKSNLKLSVGLGVVSGILIILLSFLFTSSMTFLNAEMNVATWKGLLASFYGGIAEEVVFRLFLMTLFVWISTKLTKTKEGLPTSIGVWISIVVSTILFGLGHLGITQSITAITPMVILRAIALNGIGGIIFSWLYWKKGLESVIIAHFSADIVIHVITPWVARLY